MTKLSTLKPCGIATGIGSFPLTDSDLACDLILKFCPDSPYWPQLPKISFLENMNVQYVQGMPGIKLDLLEQKIYFETKKVEQEMQGFYERYLSDDPELFEITKEYSSGFSVLVRKLKKSGRKPRFVKGQVTGPISFGMTVTDENRKAVAYNKVLQEAVVKNMAMKARRQAKKLKGLADEVLIFIDEPYMSSFGSAFFNLSREDVISQISEVIEAIHKQDAYAGVHCCGNTDWTLLFETGCDILSFDAFTYSHTVALYPEQLQKFLSRGGCLAWGIVPTAEEVKAENKVTLQDRLFSAKENLIKKGIDSKLLFEQAFVTPSCGLGSMPVDLVEPVLELASKISQEWGK